MSTKRRGWKVGITVAALVAGAFGLERGHAARAESDASKVVTVRIACVAPKGSAWGNEVEKLASDVEHATSGHVKLKVYLNGTAGDDVTAADRVKKGQLDGVVSAGWLCQEAMPSMRAMGLIGVFQSREESAFVASELKPTLEAEAAHAGYTLLGTAGLGSIIMFSREPITSMADLRKTKLWRWEGEKVQLQMGAAMGFSSVSGRLEDAGKDYDSGKVDGFFAVPMASLAFQWFALTHYITELRTGYLMGCFLMSQRSLDALPVEYQSVMREAGAKLVVRIEDTGHHQDDALLAGIFQKHGLKKVAVSDRFRAEFFDAARAAREQLGDKLVPREVLGHVMEVLTDYRSEHR
jgi:TRAP-type C4-dicarboxylate transport system substrate-binding protein